MADEIVLTVTGGTGLGGEAAFTLDEPLLIGRSHSAQMRFREPDVSGKHLEIRRDRDGVWVRCLSRHGFLFNGRERVQEGEMRKLSSGDSFMLGSRASFRVDSISCERLPPEDEELNDPPKSVDATGFTGETKPLLSGTLGTVPYTTGATEATRPVGDVLTQGTAVLNAETRPIEGDVMDDEADTPKPLDRPPPPPPPPPRMPPPPPRTAPPPHTVRRGQGAYAESSGVDDVDDSQGLLSSPLTSEGGPDGPTTPVPDGPTTTGGAKAGGTMAGGTQGGTVGIPSTGPGTVVIPPDMIGNWDGPDRNRRRKFRQRLMVFILVLFGALLGAVFLEKWINRPTEYLGVPFKPGTKVVDLQATGFRAADGELEIVVDYPHDPRMRKTESKTGVEVMTMTGRDRDCPFRLDFSIRTEPKQLGLSLEQAVAAETERLAGEGYAFIDSEKDGAVSEEERRGFFFFEIANPGSCEVRDGGGLRCFRREYTVTRGKESWWGVFTLFRNGDRLYRLFREIPASQKVRGQQLLLLDANVLICEPFLERQWESPGSDHLVKGADQIELEKRVGDLLNKNWPEDWPEIRRALDTLQVLTWGRTDDARKNVEKLMAEFRRVQADFYSNQQRKFAVALANGDEAGALRAFEACRGAFNNGAPDLRFHLLNNPEEWKCQQQQ